MKLRYEDRNTLRQFVDCKSDMDGMLARAGGGSLSHLRRLERLGFVRQDGWAEAWDPATDDPGYHAGCEYRCFCITDVGHAALVADGDKGVPK